MQAFSLNQMFAEAKGTTTFKGAEARVTKFHNGVVENQGRYNFTILTREDGTFIPVIFLGEKDFHLMHFAMDCGCCVMKA